MGLLDGLTGGFDDDEKSALRRSLMALGFGLLGARKGSEGQTAAASGLNAMNEYQQNLGLSAGLKQKKLEQQLMQQRLMQEQQAQAQQTQVNDLARSSFQPGMPEMGPPGPQGMQPAVAPKFDKEAFGKGLWTIDPQKGLAFEQAQAKESPFAKLNPSDYTQESVQQFLATGNQGVLKKAEEPASKSFAQINPNNYTRDSITKFAQSKNYADLVPTATPNEVMADARARDLNALKRQEIQGGDQPMSDDAIKNAAARYNIDGTLPPMGMGKVAGTYRSAILNEAARQAQGVDPTDQRVAQIGNKANTAALSKLKSQETMVGAFEKTFNKNVDLVTEYSAKVDRTGVPIVNKWIQAGKRAVVGDPELSAFDFAIKSAVNEYTKIISGSMGNTVMAEGEIKKIEAMLGAAQNVAQIKEITGFMKRETGNRMAGFKEQRDELTGSMRGSQSPQRQDKVLKFDAQGNMIP